jgi:ABC-2 type transport system ATP-binding protein
MSDAEIADSFDEIVDFSELAEFLDTPFKHFSSGMKVRLAFAVVSRLNEPILLIDEVLAVGDKRFRQKCLKRIEDLIGNGTTLFLVSHGEGNLRRYCKRGLYLESGELRADGPIESVIEQYERDQGTWVEGAAGQDFQVDDLTSVMTGGDDAF